MRRRRRRAPSEPPSPFFQRTQVTAAPPAAADDVLGDDTQEAQELWTRDPEDVTMRGGITELALERYGIRRATVARRVDDETGGVVPWDYKPF